MSDETRYGALVDPMGCNVQRLNEDEHQQLANLLRINREEFGDFHDAIRWLIHQAIAHGETDGGLKPEDVFANSVFHFLSVADGQSLVDFDPDAVLSSGHRGTQILSEQENRFLRHALTTYRTGSWFAEWLALQCGNVANAIMPGERVPSPLTVAGALVDSIGEFEKQIDDARELYAQRPDLFTPLAPPEAPAEPVLHHKSAMKPKPARKRKKAA